MPTADTLPPHTQLPLLACWPSAGGTGKAPGPGDEIVENGVLLLSGCLTQFVRPLLMMQILLIRESYPERDGEGQHPG